MATMVAAMSPLVSLSSNLRSKFPAVVALAVPVLACNQQEAGDLEGGVFTLGADSNTSSGDAAGGGEADETGATAGDGDGDAGSDGFVFDVGSSGDGDGAAPVYDPSGIATGTAFDFLGDGSAEAMYADETYMYIFDGAGQEYLRVDRSSGTMIE